jgi:enoyl-CoA hydratase/carnithine racemase
MTDASTTSAPVTIERDGHVAIVRLNRPDKGNAYTAAMGVALNEAFTSCDLDDDVRVIVLTGAGKAFCVGLDLSGGDSTFGDGGSLDDDTEREPFRLVAPFQLRTPVIAAMNGHAVGVGITLAMQCDIRIAAEDAKLGFVFVRRGIVAEAFGHWTVPRTIGLARTAELFFTGRIFSGREGEQYGVVNQALPTDEVLPAALEMAREIARESSPAAVAMSKRLLWSSSAMSPDEVYDAEVDRVRWLGASPDAREGVRAFLERREPAWEVSPSKDLPSWAYPET